MPLPKCFFIRGKRSSSFTPCERPSQNQKTWPTYAPPKAQAQADSPLVRAAKSSQRTTAKKKKIVITNETLSKSGGHVTTSSSKVAPLPPPPPADPAVEQHEEQRKYALQANAAKKAK